MVITIKSYKVDSILSYTLGKPLVLQMPLSISSKDMVSPVACAS